MKKYGFVGLGLIGGSIARALKEKTEDSYIVVYDINTVSTGLALELGVADEIAKDIDDKFSDCDYIFLCAPVSDNNENLKKIKSIISDKAVITDVGSVKSPIRKAIKEVGLQDCFIGGHPMAGSERTGFVNSNPVILENAYYILDPSETVERQKIEDFKELISKIGAIPLILNNEEHDLATAAVSHLPHIIAATLVNLIKQSDSENETMKLIAAGGFKDITRIASSSPHMWQQICLTNTDNIIKMLDLYIDLLNKAKTDMKNSDAEALYDLFSGAGVYRESFINTPSGPIKSSFAIKVDIPDKAVAVAHITNLLAYNNINIKNIGICHNREYEGGVLSIEFYDEPSKNEAVEILTLNKFQVG